MDEEKQVFWREKASWSDPENEICLLRGQEEPVDISMLANGTEGVEYIEFPGEEWEVYVTARTSGLVGSVGREITDPVSLRSVLEVKVKTLEGERPQLAIKRESRVKRQSLELFRAESVLQGYAISNNGSRMLLNARQFLDYAAKEKGIRPVELKGNEYYTGGQLDILYTDLKSMVEEKGLELLVVDPVSGQMRSSGDLASRRYDTYLVYKFGG